jgi:ABC-type nitrate/sulfonate/bicarbonate transport system substrate-binding protein/outer membrane protein OmpA-like peptidoglycan-associated protein
MVLCGLFVVVCAANTAVTAAEDAQSPPLREVIKVFVGEVKKTDEIQLPVITWGGDIATILANGNAQVTAKDSIFGRKGLKFKIVRRDDYKKQVEEYLQGTTPYLRGTMGMLNMAMEAVSKDPRTKPVVIYQMTWSSGGDCMVVKEGIKTVKDLKGKTIAVQAYGPHVDYLGTVLKDGGLSTKDVKILWTKDLTGTEHTPGEAFRKPNVDAAMVIIPDGLTLTSKGAVGSGAEGSVKGAKILLSTKTANRVIADVYAVRSDYFSANRDKVKAFTHGLLIAEQELAKLFKDPKANQAAYKATVTATAQMLFDSPQATADAEALYGDCEFVGFPGNVKFFGDPNWPRNFANLTSSIQTTLISAGLLGKPIETTHAKWNYDDFKQGLAGVEGVESPKFKTEEVAKVVEKKRAEGKLGEGELFSFEILFQPNQNTFSSDIYADEFNKVMELASTYGGAVIVVEGHSDPLAYLHKKKAGADEVVLKRLKQAAKNLSLTRAVEVRDGVIAFGKKKNISLDPSQFTVIGHGYSQPKTGLCGADPCPPKSKEEWLSNMRVVFRIIQVEAEESVFKPLN